MLVAVGLTKMLGGRAAVEAVHLSLRAGEIVCVAGPNGAGKTTLLSLLSGASYPSSGHLTVFGMHRWKRNFQIRRRSTFVPSETAYGACPTPLELFRLVARVHGLSRESFRTRLERLAARMSMTEAMKKTWDRLSWGMRRKAGLIAGFLPDAELRILDEPFGGGIDSLAAEALGEWMREARGRGEAFVFSTPEPDRAEGIADRLVVLDDGREVAEGPPDAVIRGAGIDPSEPEALARAFRKLVGGGGSRSPARDPIPREDAPMRDEPA